MILHGFLVFFATGNFAGSLFTLFNFLARLRLDAYNFIYSNQRPVPKIIYNLDAWNGVLLFITIISVALNALVSMFTSDSVHIREYLMNNENLSEYYKDHMSLFNQNDIFGSDPIYNQTCYYRGQFYPYNHPMKYKYTMEHWRLSVYKSVGLLIFELLGGTIILSLNALINVIFKSTDNVLIDGTDFFDSQKKKYESVQNLFKVSKD
ncbi:unnamed protein product [Brassicogethes aeneus]|uniref:Anoctamin n=1 Tax=Brassicogethes aeneus TaxID=1431903 RepID=A0A9P0ARQ6_BRAAE|nr:unnamed protein product [Brassicogethes aeneus]